MRALRQGDVAPRDHIPGEPAPPPSAFEFGFDFYYNNDVAVFDAYFPHSAHTEWVACDQCHPRIFRHRGTEVTMADVMGGKYCGECHGTVAFQPEFACERCHPGFPQPADRVSAELIGDIRMTRTEATTAFSDSLMAEGHAGADLSSVFPEATFPHWIHRSRFQCKVCHMEIFEPKAGANRISMQDISQGRACGRCHDGRVAFSYGFGNCTRCHRPEDANVASR